MRIDSLEANRMREVAQASSLWGNRASCPVSFIKTLFRKLPKVRAHASRVIGGPA